MPDLTHRVIATITITAPVPSPFEDLQALTDTMARIADEVQEIKAAFSPEFLVETSTRLTRPRRAGEPELAIEEAEHDAAA